MLRKKAQIVRNGARRRGKEELAAEMEGYIERWP
jgi:hypothetical protein